MKPKVIQLQRGNPRCPHLYKNVIGLTGYCKCGAEFQYPDWDMEFEKLMPKMTPGIHPESQLWRQDSDIKNLSRMMTDVRKSESIFQR